MKTPLFIFPWDQVVNSVTQYKSVATDTYILTFIVFLLAFLITWLLTGVVIKYRPDNRDIAYRRIAAILVGIVFALALFLYNWHVSGFIKRPALLNKFMLLSEFGVIWQSLLMFLGLYTSALFILAKASRNKKVNTIFARR